LADAELAARTLLWEWVSEREDPDPEQRAWKIHYCEGLIDACEAAGLLDADEVGRWRHVIAAGGQPPAAQGDEQAATDHLEDLLAAMAPMSREPAPEQLSSWRRFDGALSALHAAGILSDDDRRRWHSRSLAATAPWLDQDDISQLSGIEGAYAISIPATSPEEEAADAKAMADLETLSRRGRAREVFVPEALARHDGLAIAAVVARTEATEVLFHHVGGPQGDMRAGRRGLEGFSAAVDALVPPILTDNAGTRYEPVSQHPVGSHGTGGTPDPDRPRVITGVWRYQPPAPDGVETFEAVLGGASWQVANCRRRSAG
jgi:hypothetical protein